MIGQVDSVCFGASGTKALVGISVLHGNVWSGEVRLARFVENKEDNLSIAETGPAFSMSCGVSQVDWITPELTCAVAGDDFDVHILSLENGPKSPEAGKGDGEDLLQFSEQTRLSDHDDAVTSVNATRGHIVSCSFDGTFKLWDTNNLVMPSNSVNIRDGLVWDAKFADVNRADTVLTASQGGGLLVWDLREAKEATKIIKPASGIASLSVCVSRNDEKLIGCGREDGTVLCFDGRNTSKPLFEKNNLHGAGVHSVAFNPMGTKLASGGDDANIFVTGINGECVFQDQNHTDYVRGLSWKPKSSTDADSNSSTDTLLSGSWDKTLRVNKFPL